MSVVYGLFNLIIENCYKLTGNYGITIIIFTLISKLLLFPLYIWIQKNSVKMVQMQPDINRVKLESYGDKDLISDKVQDIYKKYGYSPLGSVIPTIVQLVILIGLIGTIRANISSGQYILSFGRIDLGRIPSTAMDWYILAPVLAGLSSVLLSVSQNKNNILQTEQNNLLKYGTLFFSVGISLWIGWIVPTGVVLYWIVSNILSVFLQYLLNYIIDPRKYIDFQELEKSRKEIAELESIGKKKRTIEEKKREKIDYKRFFNIENKHLVFYSEGSGYYKYYQGIIEYLLVNTAINIHYITSDINDNVFKIAENEPKLKPYYIGENKLITLMMKMDADIVATTTPDLDNYHIKRSIVRKDIEYIHIPHTMSSMNLVYRHASIDHFDTVFIVGKHQLEETRKTEEVYGLKKKTLVECGYPLLDEMISEHNKENIDKTDRFILIAPSWQEDNIMDTCLEPLLDSLKGAGYRIVVRPHPQYVRHFRSRMEFLEAKYSGDKNIDIQIDFSSNETVFDAELVVTDWSGIVYEYIFTTHRPVLFINTKMKVQNSEYKKIGIEPINVWMRDNIGKSLEPNDIDQAADVVRGLLDSAGEYRKRIEDFEKEYVYNIGDSSKVGAEYIISSLQKKIENRRIK